MDEERLEDKYLKVKQSSEDSFLIEYCETDDDDLSSGNEEIIIELKNISSYDKEIFYTNENQCRIVDKDESDEEQDQECTTEMLWAEQLVAEQEVQQTESQWRKVPAAAQSTEEEWISVTENEELIPKIAFAVWPGVTGPQVTATSADDVIHFFKLFFTEELVADIVEETNRYVKTVSSNNTIFQEWTELTSYEFWGFIGVILNMSTIIVSDLPEYWSDKANSKIPFFSNNFTFLRFNQIFFALHMKSTDRLRDGGVIRNHSINMRKLQTDNVWEYFNNKFGEYFVLGRDICIAEAIIQSDGRIRFIPYDMEKPTKSHTRIYVLMESDTGYIYHILPYHGKASWQNFVRPDMTENARVILNLYKTILERNPTAQGYHIYTENATVALAEELLKVKCYLTGVLKDTTNLPAELKEPPQDQPVAFRKDNTMVLSWHETTEKAPTVLLSTYYNAEMVPMYRNKKDVKLSTVKKPKVILNFKSFMAGVDLADQYGGMYCFLKESSTMLWRKLFFFGMHTCVINSYVLYSTVKQKNQERPLLYQKYVKLLVDQLVREYQTVKVCRTVSSNVAPVNTDTDQPHRLDGKLHIIRKGRKRDCVVCSIRKIKGMRRETSDYCDTCPKKPRMHMGTCFERYHTLDDFKLPRSLTLKQDEE